MAEQAADGLPGDADNLARAALAQVLGVSYDHSCLIAAWEAIATQQASGATSGIIAVGGHSVPWQMMRGQKQTVPHVPASALPAFRAAINPRSGPGLTYTDTRREARLAYLRAWKERNRPAPKPEPQTDPSLPPRGAMSFSADGLRVQCHVCGAWLKALNVHLRTHGLDARTYKELYDLPRTISMLPRATREKQSEAALARDLGSIGRAHIPPAVGRPKGQVARLGARIDASEQRKGINTRAGNKTRGGAG